jgi:ankyrin repeat protein
MRRDQGIVKIYSIVQGSMAFYSLPGRYNDLPVFPFLDAFEEIQWVPLQNEYCTNTIAHYSQYYRLNWLEIVNEDRFEIVFSDLSIHNSAMLSFHDFKYKCCVTSVQRVLTDSYKLLSRLKYFTAEESNASVTELLLRAHLCYASFKGHHYRVQSLLPYCKMEGECLHYAAAGGNINIVQMLLEEGCSPNSLNRNGRTPLHVPAKRGYLETLQELMKQEYHIEASKDSIISILSDEEHSEWNPSSDLDDIVRYKHNVLWSACYSHYETALTLIGLGYLIPTRDGTCNFSFIDVYDWAMNDQQVKVDHGKSCCKFVNRRDGSGCTPLHLACAKGYVKVAIELIENYDADISIVAVNAGTPLHCAVAGGHEDVVSTLLQYGCKVDVQDKCKRTPLHIATHVSIVRNLIDHLLSVAGDQAEELLNMKDEEGLTALHYAARYGLSEVVIELVQKGAFKDIVDGLYGAPLHQAAGCGHLETVAILLDAGCKVDTVNDHGMTSLHYAARRNHVDVIKELVGRGCMVDIQDSSGLTSLQHAAMFGSTEAVTELLKNGVSKNIVTHGNVTLLHLAANGEHLDTVKVLLDQGCNADTADDNGITALHHAAVSNHVDVLKELMGRGCKVDIQDNNGLTALHVAAMCGSTEAVIHLLKNGASKNVVVHDNGTLLHLAADGGHPETVRILLDEGCNVDAVDDNGMTALHHAAASNHVDVLKELIGRGCMVDIQDSSGLTSLQHAAMFGSTEAVTELLKNGASKNVVASDNDTLLHLAACGGHLETVKVLLDEGCNVNAVNDKGRTVLHYAAEQDNVDMLKEILEHNVSIDIQDKNGRSPLHLAAYFGAAKTVTELITKGACRCAITDRCGTPLHYAADQGHTEVVISLLEDHSSVRLESDSNIDNSSEQGLLYMKNDQGQTALSMAAAKRHDRIIFQLIKRGLMEGNMATEAQREEVTDNQERSIPGEFDAWCGYSHDPAFTVLHWAAKEGHFNFLKELLKQEHQKDSGDKEGLTPLHYAAANGYSRIVAELVRVGAEKELVVEPYGTPLHQAASQGHLQTVVALIDIGCDMLRTKRNGGSPLHTAAENGHADIVKELLRRGFNVDATRKNGCTPLHDAAQHGHTDVVVLLLENGANKDIVCILYGTPLHQAVLHAQFDTLKALLDHGCDMHLCSECIPTPLHVAARKGFVDIVDELLSRDCPVDIRDKKGRTPLHEAAEKGQSEVVVQLVQKGANKDDIGGGQGTPLHLAAYNGHVAALNALLDAGCNACAVTGDGSGTTPLHVAASQGHVHIIRELLSRDCPVDIRDKKGRTPLHEAAEKGQSEVVVQLVQKGANKDDIGGGQGTPLHLAAYNGHVAALNALLDAGCNACAVTGDGSGTTPLHVAASQGHVHIIRELIRRDCPVDIKKVDGCTPLHVAALYGQTEAVIALIKDGAKRDVFAENCGTPLHQAVIKGHSEMIEMLLEGREASIDDLEVLPDGRTPLHIAAVHGRTAAAVKLIRLGASKEARATFADFVKITPLEAAAFYGHLDTFVELLEEGCSMQLDYGFFLTLSKHQRAEFISELEKCLLQRGYDMDVSQEGFFRGLLARQKKRSLKVIRDRLQLNATSGSWIKAYRRALEGHGCVNVNIIRCVFIGPPKVGKSCLKHLLVHNQSKRIDHSTPVMEAPDVVTLTRELFLATTQSHASSSWEYVSDDIMRAMLKNWVENQNYRSADNYPRSSVAEIGPSHSSDNVVIPSSVHFVTLKNIREGLIDFSEEPTQSEKSSGPAHASHHSTDEWKLKIHHCHLVGQIRDIESHSESSGDSPEAAVTFINLIDSGGQPSFMDALPLLLGTPCTYVHVFNASKDVDSPAEMTYRYTDGREKTVKSTGTTWELMLRSFSSVHTLEYKCSKHLQDLMDEGKPIPSCRVAVVGTFKDELLKFPEHQSVIDDLCSRVKDFYLQSQKVKAISSGVENGDGIFFVNNLMFDNDETCKIDERQYINTLRDALSSEKAALQLKIPLMWLLLELVTRRSEVKFIKYEALKTFCLSHGYIDNDDSDEQFRALLMLFHNLGFYAYYELKGIKKEDTFVCTEATALFKEVSKLLIIHFITPKSTAAQHFQETGEILTQNDQYQELFSEIDIDPAIDQRWFLMVIHHLGLAAKVSNSAYFVPLALPYGRVNLDVKCTVAKLCFALKSKETFSSTYHLPRSVFPRLIVILSNDRDNWEPDLPRSARTTVKFIHRGAHVYITELATLIKITLILPQVAFFGYDSSFVPSASDTNKLHSLCSSVRSALTKAMGEACKSIFGDRYTEDACVTGGFLCSRCERSRETPHLAEPSKSERMPLVCCVTKELFPVSPAQRIWLAEIEPTSVQVELVNEKDGICAFWYLEVKQAVAKAFDRHAFMEKFKEKFLFAVPAKVVADKWEIFHIIDPNTCEKIKRALPSDESAILFKHIRDHGSMETVKEMCEQMIVTGEDGYPQLRRLGEDMKRDFENLNT